MLALAGAGGDTTAAEARLRSALDNPIDRFVLDLSTLHLEGAGLSEAHLDGKTYPTKDDDLKRIRQWAARFPERLDPADLSGAFLDGATALNDAVLVNIAHGAVRVVDVHWGDVNLAVIPDWSPFTEQRVLLGDERAAWEWKSEPFTESEAERKQPRKARAAARAKHDAEQAHVRLQTFQAAVRANRQLATALRAQGMNEEADHFAYRAQVVQRAVFRQQGKRGKRFFSGFLDFIAGYGYKPLRSVAVYLAVIAVFAVGYWLVGPAAGHTFAPDGALVFSVTSFHGRGFFPGGLELENWITRLAALEAVLGLIIEISFIATFTQRFFGR